MVNDKNMDVAATAAQASLSWDCLGSSVLKTEAAVTAKIWPKSVHAGYTKRRLPLR